MSISFISWNVVTTIQKDIAPNFEIVPVSILPKLNLDKKWSVYSMNQKACSKNGVIFFFFGWGWVGGWGVIVWVFVLFLFYFFILWCVVLQFVTKPLSVKLWTYVILIVYIYLVNRPSLKFMIPWIRDPTSMYSSFFYIV